MIYTGFQLLTIILIICLLVEGVFLFRLQSKGIAMSVGVFNFIIAGFFIWLMDYPRDVRFIVTAYAFVYVIFTAGIITLKMKYDRKQH